MQGRRVKEEQDPAVIRVLFSRCDGSGFCHFHVEEEFHLFRYDHATGFGDGVPVEAEVFAVDFAADFEACFDIAPGVFHDAAKIHGEFDGAGSAAHGEVAGEFEAVASFAEGAGEGDVRVFLCGEEVIRLEVAVAVGLVGVDAGHVDGELGFGAVEVLAVGFDAAAEFAEVAGDGSDDEVFNLELYFGVCGVDVPLGKLSHGIKFFC